MAPLFPKRLHGFGNKEIIKLPKHMGGQAKIYLREVAKKELPDMYFMEIETGISGQSGTGEKIPINCLGRWLFGVPGYMGHIRVVNWDDHDCIVEWPEKAPAIVSLLIKKIKEQIMPEKKRDVLADALVLIKKERPNADYRKHAAFANGVQYLVTGWSGGYGGPSVREHAVAWIYGDLVGKASFEDACRLLLDSNGPIFGPITEIHYSIWQNEHCFDDDPEDIEAVERFNPPFTNN